MSFSCLQSFQLRFEILCMQCIFVVLVKSMCSSLLQHMRSASDKETTSSAYSLFDMWWVILWDAMLNFAHCTVYFLHTTSPKHEWEGSKFIFQREPYGIIEALYILRFPTLKDEIDVFRSKIARQKRGWRNSHKGLSHILLQIVEMTSIYRGVLKICTSYNIKCMISTAREL